MEGKEDGEMIYSLLQLVKSIKKERREGADLLLWSPSLVVVVRTS